MKKFCLFIALIVLGIALYSQTPEGFNYQAVARDASGSVLSNKSVSFRISILSGSATGKVVYSEVHKNTTNAFGLVTFVIGNGDSKVGTLSAIDWSSDTYFVKTELDPAGGAVYQEMGTSQLMSVPYALMAKKVQNANDGDTDSTNELQSLSISGNNLNLSKGGGTITIPVSGGLTLPYVTSGAFSSSPFSIENTGSWYYTIAGYSKTGFGIYGKTYGNNSGGILGEGTGDNHSCGLIGRTGEGITTTLPGNTGVLGQSNVHIAVAGTAISGTGGYFSSETGLAMQTFGKIQLTGIGEGAGKVLTSDGSGNASWSMPSTSWSQNGSNLYYLPGNIGIGTNTPSTDIDITKTTGSATLQLKSVNNGALMIFDQVNDFNNHFSFIIFRKAGTNMFYSGMNYDEYEILSSKNSKGLSVNTDGNVRISDQLYLGDGGKLGIGTSSPSAGLHIKGTGFPNAFIFLESLSGNDAGIRLYEGSTAKWHIFNSSSAGGLQIYNSASSTAIFCKQTNSYVGINTTSPNYNIDVNGTAGKTGGGSWSNSSDIRLKDVIGNYNKGLNEIMAIQPILFKYKKGNARNLPSDTEQIGFVAQDIQKIFPETVSQAADGYLDFNIHAVNVAVVNAIKELKVKNDELTFENKRIIEENNQIKAENKEILQRLSNLEKQMKK